MAKNKNKKPYERGNAYSSGPIQQETSAQKTKRLIEEHAEKKNKEINKDKLIQQKLLDLEEMKLLLEEEYKRKHTELDARLIELDESRLELAAAREQMIENIRKDEENIRRFTREEWEIRFTKEKQEAEENLADMREKIIKDRETAYMKAKEEAHYIILSAEEERMKLLEEGRNRLQKIYAEADTERQKRQSDVEIQEREVSKQKKQLEIQLSDLDADIEMLNSEKEKLKELYEGFSPGMVRDLQLKLELIEKLSTSDKNEIENLHQEVQRLRSYLPQQGARSLDSILQELEEKEESIRQLEDRLASLPSEVTLGHLRLRAEEAEVQEDEIRELRQKLNETTLRATRLDMDQLALTQAKLETEALRGLNEELQKVLRQQNEMRDTTIGERFKGLCDLDRSISGGVPFIRRSNITLNNIVTHVQTFGASSKKLFYSTETIRRFIAGLFATRLIILQGLSGTGKSSLPQMFAEAIGGESHLIPVQPSWRDRNELLGFDNDFTKRFKETEFTKTIYKAGLPSEKHKINMVILDEMNLARIEYYFADFLSLLEKSDPQQWKIPLISDDSRSGESGPKWLLNGSDLVVNKNTWFIGTANRDDSTFDITDKVYDRAQILEFLGKQGEETIGRSVAPIHLSIDELEDLFEMAYMDAGLQLQDNDWEIISKLDHFLSNAFGITFGNRFEFQIKKFVPVYLAAGGTKADAIDYQMARKVLRNLESRYEPHLVPEIKNLKEYMKQLLPNCAFLESYQILDQRIRSLGE